MKIGIILGSTREQRVSEQVGKWALEQSKLYGSAAYEMVDIRDFDLPFLGTSEDVTGISKWNSKLSEFDGFVFILAEYNHSMPASLKNALDLALEPWNNKAAGIISYGSAGGARATEHLRGVLGELQVADIRTHILLSLFTDFENGSIFKPMDIHKSNLQTFFPQLESWSKALKTIR